MAQKSGTNNSNVISTAGADNVKKDAALPNQTKVVTPIIKKVVINTPATKKSKAANLDQQESTPAPNKNQKNTVAMTEPRPKANPITNETGESPT